MAVSTPESREEITSRLRLERLKIIDELLGQLHHLKGDTEGHQYYDPMLFDSKDFSENIHSIHQEIRKAQKDQEIGKHDENIQKKIALKYKIKKLANDLLKESEIVLFSKLLSEPQKQKMADSLIETINDIPQSESNLKRLRKTVEDLEWFLPHMQATQRHLDALSEKTHRAGALIAELALHSPLEKTEERYGRFNTLLLPIHNKLKADEFDADEVEFLMADLDEFSDELDGLLLSFASTEEAQPEETATKEMKHEEAMKTSDGPNEFGKKISEAGLCIARLAPHSLADTTRMRHDRLVELIKQNDLNELNRFIDELHVEMMKAAIKNGHVIPSLVPNAPAEDKRESVCTPSVVGWYSTFPPAVTVVTQSETPQPTPSAGMAL